MEELMAEKSKLDTIANIAIIVVCVIASVVLVRNFFFQPKPAGGPPQVEKGERLEALQAKLPAGADRTLVLAVSPQCHFCTESMPFYKRIVDERNQKGSAVKVVVAVPRPEAREEEQKHLTSAGVQNDAMIDVDFGSIKVPGTPTLLLVDKKGKVLNVWVGKLEEDGEEDVIAAL
jgi:thioredoxin-related protein